LVKHWHCKGSLGEVVYATKKVLIAMIGGWHLQNIHGNHFPWMERITGYIYELVASVDLSGLAFTVMATVMAYLVGNTNAVYIAVCMRVLSTPGCCA